MILNLATEKAVVAANFDLRLDVQVEGKAVCVWVTNGSETNVHVFKTEPGSHVANHFASVTVFDMLQRTIAHINKETE